MIKLKESSSLTFQGLALAENCIIGFRKFRGIRPKIQGIYDANISGESDSSFRKNDTLFLPVPRSVQ
ncbi:hypothetical protein BWD13_13215 [Leptospira santarosai serovar Grippotyphosa]|nr:hypothetical protein BWD13_13215 [Leptospira santarosai serovar Grippotyphosa]